MNWWRWTEFFKGDNGRLSSEKLGRFIVIIVLSATMFRGKEPSEGIAAILAGLAIGTLVTQRAADVKLAQAAQGPSPIVTATVQGDMNVKPEEKGV